MNLQAMMKQAQQLQKDMTYAKDQINKTIYKGQSTFVTVEVNGKKDVLKVSIDKDTLDKEEIEILEDVLIIALRDANKMVDADTEEKLGKYTKGMPGLF
jgi:DNA-binding YbaB/EbfC family protein